MNLWRLYFFRLHFFMLLQGYLKSVGAGEEDLDGKSEEEERAGTGEQERPGFNLHVWTFVTAAENIRFSGKMLNDPLI